MQDAKRGRSAIDAVHAGVAREDEDRMSTRISEIYGVNLEEAADIHANYHVERILTGLERRARENGMTKEALVESDDRRHIRLLNRRAIEELAAGERRLEHLELHPADRRRP